MEHQIFRFAEIILRDRCSTSYDLASLFRGRRSTLDRWTGKIAKRIKTHWYEIVSSPLNFPFLKEVSQNSFVLLRNMRKSRKFVSFLMLSRSKVEESRRIAAFLMLSSSKTEEVSQNTSFSCLPVDR